MVIADVGYELVEYEWDESTGMGTFVYEDPNGVEWCTTRFQPAYPWHREE